MAILTNDFTRPKTNAFPMQRAGALIPSRAQHVPTVSEQLSSNIPTIHRKPVVMKPILKDGLKSKSFSNSNNPLIVYNSAPLDNILENITFKKKPKQKGMGVKLVI